MIWVFCPQMTEQAGEKQDLKKAYWLTQTAITMQWVLFGFWTKSGALQRRKTSKNHNLLWKWAGGSRSHSENHPKITLNQYWYFGVVYHVCSLYIYIVKSGQLLWFECSVQVSDGFPKKSLDGYVWGELYQSLFWIFGIVLTLHSP